MMPASNQGVGMNIGFPDVCNTPVGPATVPLPYPNIGANATSMPFVPNCLVSMVPGHNQLAKPLLTNGDNAGVAHPMFMQAGGNNMGNPMVLMTGVPSETLLNPTQGNNYNNPLGSKLVPSVVNVLMSWAPSARGWSASALADAAAELHDRPSSSLGLTTGAEGARGPRVLHVRRGGLADRLGVAPGDELVAVDGAALDAGQELPSVAPGRRVSLTVRRAERVRTLRGVQAEAPAPAAEAAVLADGVGHLVLRRFSLGAASATRAALARLEAAGARALVLDLRGNPGGSLEAAVEVAGLFLAGAWPVALGRVVSPAGERIATWRSPAGPAAWSRPVAVLVDGGSASAAEVLAAALQDHGRAVVVGAPTLGKGWATGVAATASAAAPDGRGARLRRPSGADLARGVRPDRPGGDDPLHAAAELAGRTS